MVAADTTGANNKVKKTNVYAKLARVSIKQMVQIEKSWRAIMSAICIQKARRRILTATVAACARITCVSVSPLSE